MVAVRQELGRLSRSMGEVPNGVAEGGLRKVVGASCASGESCCAKDVGLGEGGWMEVQVGTYSRNKLYECWCLFISFML